MIFLWKHSGIVHVLIKIVQRALQGHHYDLVFTVNSLIGLKVAEINFFYIPALKERGYTILCLCVCLGQFLSHFFSATINCRYLKFLNTLCLVMPYSGIHFYTNQKWTSCYKYFSLNFRLDFWKIFLRNYYYADTWNFNTFYV